MNRFTPELAFTTTPRPNCTAFLIAEHTPVEELARYVQFSTMVWGGRLNVFVLCREDGIDPTWLEFLRVACPDVLVFGESLRHAAESLRGLLWKRLAPFALYHWDDKWIERMEYAGNLRHDLPMPDVLNAVLPLTRPERTRSTVLATGGLNDRQLLRFALFGLCSKDLDRAYREHFDATEHSAEGTDLPGTIALHELAREEWTPLRHTVNFAGVSWSQREGGSIFFHGFPRPFIVIASDQENITDFCLFWNLQQYSVSGNIGCAWVLRSHLARRGAFRQLALWVANADKSRANWVTVASGTLGEVATRKIADRLQRAMRRAGYRVYVDARWADLENLLPTDRHVTAAPTAFHSVPAAGQAYLPVPRYAPGSGAGSRGQFFSRQVVDVAFQPISHGYRGYALPTSGVVTEALQRIGRYFPPFVRPTRAGMSVSVQSQDARPVYVPIPDLPELIREGLRVCGLEARPSPASRLVEGCLAIAGGLTGAAFLRKTQLRRLLKQLSYERGARPSGDTTPSLDTGVLPREIYSRLRGGRAQWKGALSSMVTMGVLRRGYRIRCQTCGLEPWVALDRYAADSRCPGCGHDTSLELEHPIAYSLNELFVRVAASGGLAVVLALLAARSHCTRSFSYCPGIEALQGGQTIVEIDAVCVCDGVLCALEIKDVEPGLGTASRTRPAPWENREQRQRLVDQVSRIQEVMGKMADCQYWFVATERKAKMPTGFVRKLEREGWLVSGLEDLEKTDADWWFSNYMVPRPPASRAAHVRRGVRVQGV
jgi:hypothetical protein